MQVREKNRNEIIEHKKRIEKHKKSIESDVSNSNMLSEEVIIQEKTANENIAIKKKVIKKKKIDKKAMREKQNAAAEKVMDDARKGNINIEKNLIEEEPEESKVVITKEERAERFKRLHAMVQDMMKKQNE
jgi:hypothetical protein